MLLNRKNKINFHLMQEYEGKKLNLSITNCQRLICQRLPYGDNFNVYPFLFYDLFLVFGDNQRRVHIHKTGEADQCVHFSASGLAVAQGIAYLNSEVCVGYDEIDLCLLVVII